MIVKYNGNDVMLEEVNWDEEKAYDTKDDDLEDTIELDKIGDTDE